MVSIPKQKGRTVGLRWDNTQMTPRKDWDYNHGPNKATEQENEEFEDKFKDE